MIFGNDFIIFPDGEVMTTNPSGYRESINKQLKSVGATFKVVEMAHPDGRKVLTDDPKTYISEGFLTKLDT